MKILIIHLQILVIHLIIMVIHLVIVVIHFIILIMIMTIAVILVMIQVTRRDPLARLTEALVERKVEKAILSRLKLIGGQPNLLTIARF